MVQVGQGVFFKLNPVFTFGCAVRVHPSGSRTLFLAREPYTPTAVLGALHIISAFEVVSLV